MSIVERPQPEPVEAFQVDFTQDDVLDRVFDAFGSDGENFTIRVKNGNWSLDFPWPQKPATSPAPSSNSVINGTINGTGTCTIQFSNPSPSGVVVSEGSWVVTRYGDTDYPEVFVMSDEKFQRKYLRNETPKLGSVVDPFFDAVKSSRGPAVDPADDWD